MRKLRGYKLDGIDWLTGETVLIWHYQRGMLRVVCLISGRDTQRPALNFSFLFFFSLYILPSAFSSEFPTCVFRTLPPFLNKNRTKIFLNVAFQIYCLFLFFSFHMHVWPFIENSEFGRIFALDWIISLSCVCM